MARLRARQQKLMQQLADNEILLIAASPERIRSNDVHYHYRQDSNLLYLTNWPESNSALIITSKQAWFFCQAEDPVKTIWEGAVLGLDYASSELGLECFNITELSTFFQKNFSSGQYSFLTAGHVPTELADYSWQKYTEIASFRAVKDEYELSEMQQAIAASIAGHKAIMQTAAPGITERELYGIWLQQMHAIGLQYEAYPAIIAAGVNACTLHYKALSGVCQSGQLLLVDAGMECNGYAADLTRTIPINGKFSPEQRDVYQAVLTIQEQAVRFTQPNISFAELNEYVSSLYQTALLDLGVKGDFKKYAPHGIGHSLGLDVHDLGLTAKAKIPVSAVITIEPGLYFRDTVFAGIGVRIEDNYLMTDQGLSCLSSDLAKDLDLIEELCA